jgi:hypothetical protein
MIKILTDPRVFSVCIVVLFALATMRYAFARDLKQTLYWGGGFILNFAVTFLADKQ